MIIILIMLAYTVCVVGLCLTSQPQMKRDLYTRIKYYWVCMMYGADHNIACEEADLDAHGMLARHLKKAGLSPDDKQDIIASERARRRIIAENESASSLDGVS